MQYDSLVLSSNWAKLGDFINLLNGILQHLDKFIAHLRRQALICRLYSVSVSRWQGNLQPGKRLLQRTRLAVIETENIRNRISLSLLYFQKADLPPPPGSVWFVVCNFGPLLHTKVNNYTHKTLYMLLQSKGGIKRLFVPACTRFT